VVRPLGSQEDNGEPPNWISNCCGAEGIRGLAESGLGRGVGQGQSDQLTSADPSSGARARRSFRRVVKSPVAPIGRSPGARIQCRSRAVNRAYGTADTRQFPPRRCALTVRAPQPRTRATWIDCHLPLGFRPGIQCSRSALSWRSPVYRWCTLPRPMSKRCDGYHKKALLPAGRRYLSTPAGSLVLVSRI
jgi:hypothetical protein